MTSRDVALPWALGTRPALAIRNGVADTTDVAVGEITPTATHGMCTATLISRNAVLTSASCLSDTTLGAVFTFAPSSTQSASIVKVVVHPEFSKFNGNASFDIAIGLLSKAQNRTWNFPFPTLATVEPATGNNGTAVGFGQTADVLAAGSRNSGQLAVSSFSSGSDSTGATFPDGVMQLNPGTGANQMVCPGDIGGPLFVNNQLAGVAAFVHNLPCSQAGPAFAVPTARLHSWIITTRNQVDPPGACEVDDDAAFATANGGCEDLKSRLVWSALSPNALDRAGAIAYCKNLNEAGLAVWYLPTVHNLAQLDIDDTGHHIAEPSSVWAADSAREEEGYVYSFRYHHFFYVDSDSYHKARCAH
jgi:hypothetical protein